MMQSFLGQPILKAGVSRVPPLVLAVLIQIAPFIRQFVLNPFGGSAAGQSIVFKLVAATALLAGGIDAVSGASGNSGSGVTNVVDPNVPRFTGPTSFSDFRVGVSNAFNIPVSTVTNTINGQIYSADYFTVSGLPLGLNITTVTSGLGRIYGTPITNLVQSYIFPVTVTAWEKADFTGGAISQTFSLTVFRNGDPPSIYAQPSSARRVPGRDAALTVTSVGKMPLLYQWRRDGTNLVGRTNVSIGFTNVSAADAGAYSVVVSNALGAITSQVASLSMAKIPRIGPSMASGKLLLNFLGETGMVYRLESCTNAASTNWAAVTDIAPLADAQVTLTNVPPATPTLFRLRVLEP